MPAWQGTIADTVRFLLGEGKAQDEAIAIAYQLAEHNGATKSVDVVPLTALSRRAHIAELSDSALAVACHRTALIRKSAGRAKMTKIEVYLRAEAGRRWSQKWENDHAGSNPGVMLAAMLPAELAKSIAIDDGEAPELLHCTIGYLGRMSELCATGSEALARARETVAKVAAATPALRGRIGGMGRFAASASSDGMDVIYAALDVPGLAEFRHVCLEALKAADVPVRRDHGFNPHVTLAYVGESDPTPEMTDAVRGASVAIENIALVIGNKTDTEFPMAPAPSDLQLKTRIVRAAPELRYTLSVAYPVSELDAHKNFANADALELAAWDYLRKSRAVGLMHKDGTNLAGELVESYIYRGPDWTVEGQTVKSGDWLAGIIWSPEAWELVRSGDYQGLSFQGLSTIDDASLSPAAASVTAVQRSLAFPIV